MATLNPDDAPMPSEATRNLFLLASGFGIGALVILAVFVLLIGVGEIGQRAATPATPVAQSAATAAASQPAPQTSGQAGAGQSR
jgi:hypothetical protein